MSAALRGTASNRTKHMLNRLSDLLYDVSEQRTLRKFQAMCAAGLEKCEPRYRPITNLDIEWPQGTVEYAHIARYEFALQGERETRFTPLTSEFRSANPLDVPTGRLRIDLSASRPDKYKVRLVVTPQTGEPITVTAAEP